MTAAVPCSGPGPGDAPRRAARAVAGFAPRLVGPSYVVASCASLQSGAAIATTMFAAFGPAGTGALRFLAAALILALIVRPRVRRRPAAFWGTVAALGATTVATNLFLYEAIARIPLGTAGTLVFLGPFALALLSTRRRLDVAWAVAAGGGVVLLTGASSGVSPLGVVLAVGAAASVAASILIARRLGERSPGLDGLTLSIAVAAVLTLPLSATALAGAASATALPLIAVVGAMSIAIPTRSSSTRCAASA